MEKRPHIAYDVELADENIALATRMSTDATSRSEDLLLQILQALWAKRAILLRTAVLTSLIVLIVSLTIPTTYRSTTLLMPPDDQTGTKAAMLAGLASKVGGGELGFSAGDLLGTRSNADMFIAILRSRTAQDLMIDQFDLTTVYGVPWLHLRAQREDARKQLDFNTEISNDRKSGVIGLSVTDHDPKRSAAIANGYADQLNRLIARLSTSSAGRERQFLEQRLLDVKQDLDHATAELSQFSSKNTTIDPSIQGKATVDAIASLEGQLVAAESQLRGLQAIYAPENIRVRSLQARVTELRTQLRNLSGDSGSSSAANTGANQASELPFPSLRELPLLGATYIDLVRRVKIEETVYQVLTQQYEMAKIQEVKDTPTMRILDPAEVPIRKFGPHRGVLAAMGAIAGLLLGSLFVVGTNRWEQWDPSAPRKIFLSSISKQVQSGRVGRRLTPVLQSVSRLLRYKLRSW
jgi:uncharacterized protein involved in exopolysaccharide biosynthesis